jgi:hypothetical protein
MGWRAYLRPFVGFVVDPLASAGRWHLTLWGKGAAQGGREGNLVILLKGPNPRTTTQHTTHT